MATLPRGGLKVWGALPFEPVWGSIFPRSKKPEGGYLMPGNPAHNQSGYRGGYMLQRARPALSGAGGGWRCIRARAPRHATTGPIFAPICAPPMAELRSELRTQLRT